jgi:hypothetical protein
MGRVRTTAALLAVVTGMALALSAGAAAQAAPAARPGGAVDVPVTGTFTDALGGVGSFAGTFTANQVTDTGGVLAAVGTVAGTLTDSTGTVLGTASQSATLPLQAAGTCQILHLDLGPLDLNLLGLRVHLNEVVLDITAQQGSGNLLGNLLCAVAHLLDNPANSLSGLVAQLNHILSLL